MRYIYGLAVFVLVCLAGCKEKAPSEAAAPEAPPPKTTQQIYSEYKAALQPLFNAAKPNGGFGEGQKGAIISTFSTTRAQMRSELNEPEAKGRIEKDVSTNIKAAKRAEQWYAIDALLDVHKALRPDSQVHISLRRRTDLMLGRPQVKCTGFATIDANDLLSFLEIRDPKTKVVDSFRIREGEEFYPGADGKDLLKLIKVIGNQSAIEMEYLALPGETWVIPGPKNN